MSAKSDPILKMFDLFCSTDIPLSITTQICRWLEYGYHTNVWKKFWEVGELFYAIEWTLPPNFYFVMDG